jgi:anaerobic magnesium-protoporphyrin IX monomethyl ester cyclase
MLPSAETLEDGMVILYNPVSSATKKPILPFALLALGAVLEGRCNYIIVDGNLEVDPLQRIDGEIRRAVEDCVLAVTVMPGPQLMDAVSLCQQLRKTHAALTIVWGGYFPTQHWEVCLRSGLVNYVVRGHSEFAFAQLLDVISRPPVSDTALSSIDGLAYVAGSGSPISNPLAPLPVVKDLPALNLGRLPVERYIRHTYLGQRTLGYHSSYGCPFFCNFCAVVNMVGGRWSAQTAEQVARNVTQYATTWNVDGVEFYDNNFFVHEDRSAEFSDRIADLKLGWWGEARIDTLLKYSSSTWSKMRRSGLKMIFMGAESGSVETLRRMDKGGTMSPDKTLEIARMMKALDIVPEFSFVLGSPPDPAQDINDTITFIRKVKQVNPAAEIVMYLYTPVPLAGDLYDQAQTKGFEFPASLDEWVSPKWNRFSQRRSHGMPWLTQSLHERLHDFERVLNAYYPTATDARLTIGHRILLRTVSAWRYRSRFYRFPIELRALQRLLAYQRPETSGF